MQNLRISGVQTFPQSESDIRVSFVDRMKIIAAANVEITSGSPLGQGQFFSQDGGETWGQTNLPLVKGDALHADPAVDWTSDGTAWAITIGYRPAQKQDELPILKLRCYRSVDGGATWSYDADASGTQGGTDRDVMWVDHGPSSPFRDNIYVTWHNGGPAFVNRRTGPSGSWQTPVQVSGPETTGTAVGGDIKTNRAGDVFAFWPDTGSQNLFAAKSTNGGAGFAAPVAMATTFGSFAIAIPAFNQRRYIDGSTSGPAIYISGGACRTPAKDLVYAVWTDLSGEAGCTSGSGPDSDVTSKCKTRIWFTRSIDGGANWEAARMINNQPSLNDQFHPRLAVDDTNGQLIVVYYDTVADPNRVQTDLWMQQSLDDGRTWGPAVKVTTAPTDETSAGADTGGAGFGAGDQYGDYIGLSGYGGIFFPSWTDRRNGAREEIWTTQIRLPVSLPWLSLLLVSPP
ncbi:MAG TPA: sialidase family protein [Candidatus Acidoferrales bacterium]|nr:sialidase family protein [Candidatus Acidoferrales bacterium]